MKVLLTGAAGQLGQALFASCPEGVELICSSRNGGPGQEALDLADDSACREAVETYRPDWVLNAGAYTAVDKAESEPELALAVNALAPAALAQAMQEQGGRLLQLSTDFVFNGDQGSPYLVDQSRNPLGVYGSTKAKGEEAVEAVFGNSGEGIILRTSWVVGPVGKNFALTMLRLHREREQLGVVSDQVGCPSSTLNLATACWRAVQLGSKHEQPLPPVLHWSDTGAAAATKVRLYLCNGQQPGWPRHRSLSRATIYRVSGTRLAVTRIAGHKLCRDIHLPAHPGRWLRMPQTTRRSAYAFSRG